MARVNILSWFLLGIILVLLYVYITNEPGVKFIDGGSGNEDNNLRKFAVYLRVPNYVDDAQYTTEAEKMILDNDVRLFIFFDTWNGIDKARILKQVAQNNNIDIDILMYLNLGMKRDVTTCDGTTETLYGELCDTVDPNWFLIETDGTHYYYWDDPPKITATDPASGWYEEFTSKGLERANQGVYFDGLFGDDLWSNIYNRYHEAFPRDYSDDISWQTAVRNALVNSGNIVNTQYPNKKLFFNLGSSHDKFDGLWENWISINGIDGFLEEFFAQSTDRYNWFRDVERLQYSESIKKNIIANWITDKKLYDDGSIVEEDKQVMFAFASYLLGINDYSYFSFSNETDALFYSIFNFDIGNPVDKMVCVDDWSPNYKKYCYREFENGLVIVNPKWAPRQGMSYVQEINDPDITNSRTVPLSASYEVLDENSQVITTVSGQIIVPPYTGVILRKTL